MMTGGQARTVGWTEVWRCTDLHQVDDAETESQRITIQVSHSLPYLTFKSLTDALRQTQSAMEALQTDHKRITEELKTAQVRVS